MSYNTFQDLFTREEIRLLSDVKETGYAAMFPILLRAPMQTDSTWLADDEQGTAVTLRLYYASQVWSKTYAIMSKRHASSTNPLNEYVWDNWNESFRIIRFKNPKHEEMVRFFWNELEQIANSGEISVSEGVQRWTGKKEAWQWPRNNDYDRKFEHVPHTRIIVDIKEMSEDRGHSKDYTRKFSGTSNKTYTWDEIKDLFVQLQEKLISCLDEERMHRHEPSDEPLFDACENLNFEGVKRAVANGANVNALNSEGASPMAVCCEAIKDVSWDEIGTEYIDYCYPEPQAAAVLEKRTATVIPILQFLMENGAKIDLCGGCESNPLHISHYFPDAGLMRFLLERGADPNVNCWLTDYWSQWYLASSTLDGVWSDQVCDGDSLRLTKMERLLLEHGARYYIDGLDDEKEWPSTTEKNHAGADIPAHETTGLSALDARLFKACAKLSIGGILGALSAGANIRILDKQGRRLLSVAIEHGGIIGRELLMRRFEERSFGAPPPEERENTFKEHLLTTIICLVGQDNTLLDEDAARIIDICRERDYQNVADWLIKKRAGNF
jgi:hypothetical protein